MSDNLISLNRLLLIKNAGSQGKSKHFFIFYVRAAVEPI